MFKSLLRFFLIVQSMICLGKCSPKHLKRMYVLLFLGRIFYRCQLWQVDCLAFQASLSMGFSRQEYWSGLPFPPLGDFPDSGIAQASPMSSELQEDSLLLSRWEAPLSWLLMPFKSFISLQIFSLFYWLLEGGIKFSRYVSFFFKQFYQFLFHAFHAWSSVIKSIYGLPRWCNGKEPALPMQETQETQVRFLSPEDPLEQETATRSSILAWEIPWCEAPGRL